MKLKFLFSQNQTIAGHAIHFEKEEVADIPDAEAEKLIIGLCAEPDKFPDVIAEPPKKGKKEGSK